MSHYPPDAKWNEMAPAGIIPQAGNAVEYQTGGWRSERPVRDSECCIDCLFCWVYCPDNAIEMESKSVKNCGIDLQHCKGCAICAHVCPKDCIQMKPETDFAD